MARKMIEAISMIIFIILTGFVEINAATNAELLFNQSSVSANVGQTITLIAQVNPGTNEVGGVELDINFDPDVLRLDSITRSSAFNITFGEPIINNTNGTGSIDVGLLTDPATYITDTSDIATFIFTTLSASSNSPISFAVTSDASAHGEYVVATRTESQVIVNSVIDEDIIAPLVTAFIIPSTSSSLTIPITTLTATDAVGVAGYVLTESSSAPLANASGWSDSVPASYTFSSTGTKTLYAWAKDAAGNISTSLSNNVIIAIDEEEDDDEEGEEEEEAKDNSNAPIISDGSPSGKLSSNTKSVNLSVNTSENATCKFSSDSNIEYDLMSGTFANTGTTNHSSSIGGLKDNRNYDYYVRCKNGNENENNADYKISFSVKEKDSKDEKKKEKRKITNSQSNISKGQVLIQSGKRFSKNADVLLYFSKVDGGYYPPMKIKTSSDGKFSVFYKVNKPSGKYSWYAVDTKTGKKSNLKSYTIK